MKKYKLDGVTLHVDSESWNNSVEATDHPVEDGINITDHVERKPQSLSFDGLIVGSQKEVEELVKRFETNMNKGKRMTFEGKRIYPNMLIISFDCDTDKTIGNGYRFQMSLKEIRIAKPSYVKEIKPVTNAGRKQTKNKPKVVYHLVKKGDTYWGMQQKYGTRWQQLEKWNGYPPTRIPIGVKLRVA